MFFSDGAFTALQAGSQRTWMEQQIHMQNLANLETPGYKAKELSFEGILEKAQGKREMKLKLIEDDTFSIRNDGNNVDFERENIEMYKSYAQYSMLLDRIRGEFDKYSYVLNSNMK